MRRIKSNIVSVKSLRAIAAVLLLIGAGPLFVMQAHAAELLQRSLTISTSKPSALANYRSLFYIQANNVSLGSIVIEYCSNTPLFDIPCVAPIGFNLAGSNVTLQGGEVGFNKDNNSTSNKLLLSRAPANTFGGPVGYTLTGVTNPANVGTYYARYSIYSSSDGTGTDLDHGAVAFSINDQFSVSTEVPPFLEMCVGTTIVGTDCNTAAGDYIDMGDFAATNASTGRTQIVLSTNADNGYTISVSGNTMTSGNNVIPNLTSPTTSAPGSSQFGINLRSNNTPSTGDNPAGNGNGQPTPDYNQVNRFKYSSGDIIASYNDVEDHRKYTVSYLVNINKNQPPGIYSSTFTYTGTGNF